MWWPFRRSASKDDAPTLARRVEDLEHGARMLQGEWLDTLEQLRKLQGRLAKRDERASEGNGVPAPTSPLPEGTRAALTAAQRIALRRRH